MCSRSTSPLCLARILLLFLLALAGMSTCSALAQKKLEQQVPAERSRIVSIGGDITEIIYALGLEARIVAVDSTSQFPAAALKSNKSVGYMRALSTEGVLSMRPSLVIASERAGPPEVVKAIKSAVAYIEIAEGTSAEGVPRKIEAVAVALGVADRGLALARRVSDEIASLAVDRKTITKPLEAMFILNTQAGRVTVGGSGTSADAILALAGLGNVARALNGFKPLSDEALLALRPQIAVVMARSSGDHDGEAALALPALAASPAGRERRLVVMDGLLLLGFGPRVAEAARKLMRAAYGETPSSRSRAP